MNDEEKQVGQTPNGTSHTLRQRVTVGEVPPSPVVEEEKELPEVTDEIVKTLSPEVCPLKNVEVDVRHGKNMLCSTRMQGIKHTHQENSTKQSIYIQKQSCVTPTPYSTLTEPHVRPLPPPPLSNDIFSNM